MDYSTSLALIFGGCCSNVWTYEQILRQSPKIGSALTFSQMLFITLQSLPSFVEWRKSRWGIIFPALKQRQAPISHWAAQVSLLTTGSLLNNWVYAFHVPLTVQIVFRSAGVVIAMILGRYLLHRRYTSRQILAVLLVSIGVSIASISTASSNTSMTDLSRTYVYGILMLIASLFATAILGILQERTYRTYGPCWREGVFYTHLLSLPIFLFLREDVIQGFESLSNNSKESPISLPYIFMALNLLTQVVCVSGVNKLTSATSSVSTSVVLTVRKAISLCLSIWYFGSDWNYSLVFGAGMVFVGSLTYSTAGRSVVNKKE
ncbi:UAA transporter [Thelephora terrestris]|uniref:UAA transporter n=1 Tax=Thelephora terrestris TaxID=56493 RepID=A0A9P6L1X4_9AGAM|nr:UAA transporter [Thelephora terrestris]